jgi:hypothetical protein
MRRARIFCAPRECATAEISMRSTFLSTVCGVAFLCVAAAIAANTVMIHSLTTLQFGPHGELLVSGTMGWLLGTDGGRSWTTFPTSGSAAAATSDDSIEAWAKTHALEWARRPDSIPAIDRKGRRYACSKDRMHVDISDDDGESWQPTEPLDKSKPGSQNVANGISMIIDINGRERALRDGAEIRAAGELDQCSRVTMIADIPYVLADSGIYRSEDRGLHWIGNYHFLGRFPVDARLFGDSHGTLYVNQRWVWRSGDDHLRLYRSTDQGATWEKMTFNFAATDLTRDLALLRIRDDTLYFALRSDERGLVSLCRSRDGKTAMRLLDFDRSDFPQTSGLDFFDIGSKGEWAVLSMRSLFLSDDEGKSWRLIGPDN